MHGNVHGHWGKLPKRLKINGLAISPRFHHEAAVLAARLVADGRPGGEQGCLPRRRARGLVPCVDAQSGPAFSRTGTDPTGEVGCLPDERVVVATGGHYALMRRAFSSGWQVTHANSGDVMLRDPLAKRRVDARLPSATAGLEVLDYLR